MASTTSCSYVTLILSNAAWASQNAVRKKTMSTTEHSVDLFDVYEKKSIVTRISSDKACNLPKRDVRFILLK